MHCTGQKDDDRGAKKHMLEYANCKHTGTTVYTPAGALNSAVGAPPFN